MSAVQSSTEQDGPPANKGVDFIPDGSEAARVIREVDWASTPLGDPMQWSSSLRMMVPLLLANRFPMLLWWGPEYIQIYNDAYAPVLGAKHPWAMGVPTRECWSEIWDVLKPMIDTPFNGGPSTWLEDFEVEINRHGFTEESHFTVAYSPVPDDTAPLGIGGVLATVHEISEKVIGERRVRILHELGSRVAEAKTDREACAMATSIFAQYPKDVPFALLYLLDEDGAELRLVSTTGVDSRFYDSLHLNSRASQHPWPLAQAVRTEKMQVMQGLTKVLPEVPPGPWSDPPESVAVVPIRSNVAHRPAGALVIGISSHIRFDHLYTSFVELVGSQIATAVANARAYEEERRRAAALAEIDRAKTAFFSNVSHEFRTPLTLMLGPVEDALASSSTSEPLKSQLELAHRNALRLLKLVNSLLDFARIEAGRVEASFEPVDLAALTRDLASTFRSTMERADLEYEVDCPALDEPVCVDREMWEKIVLNLLSNAFKFTLAGSVRVSMHREENAAVLEIADTGVGVPQNELPRLFDRFYRVESTNGRTHEGSGIGLALVQELVTRHGGAIAVSSTLGQGTAFRITIPFGTAHLPRAHIGRTRSIASTAISSQAYVQEALRWLPDAPADSVAAVRGLTDAAELARDTRFASTFGSRVVLADDNADMRAYVGGLLGPLYEVEAVFDGQYALDALRRKRPDLILCDVMMPRLDGFGVLKAMRADPELREVPAILLSARAGEEARIEGLNAGADDYIVKPFAARELLARVGALLELTRTRQENEERFRAYVQATSDVVYRMSADWTEMRRLHGRNFIADTTGPSRTWLHEYIHPDDQRRVLEAIRHAVTTRSVFELEHRVVRADGSLGWTFSRAVPMRDRQGEVTEWFGAASDVTEHHEMQESLQHRASQFEGLFSNAPIGMFVVDADFRVCEVNPIARPSFGEGPVIGRDFGEMTRELWSAEYAEEVIARYRHTLATGEPFYTAERIEMRRDLGVIESYEWQINRIPLPTGQFGVVCYFRDISKYIEARRELIQQQRRLETADRQKDEFLAMLAHELRNPLAPIRNAGEILSRVGSTHPHARTAIATIERQVTHLTRLVDDLLDVSRITQGRIELRRRPTVLSEVVSRALETVDPAITQKRHTVSVVSGRRPLIVNVDPERLVQCLANILTNAAKYTPVGGQIRVECREEGDEAVVSVTDNGVGISSDLLPRVFDLFVQDERTLDRAQGGLGIGLSIVKRLVEMHHGSICASSAGVSQGSTFEIHLPLMRGTAVPVQPKAPEKVAARRVLIVDDNEDAANTLAMILKLEGHETEVSYSGSDALERVQSFRPDAVLLDIGLPGLDGYTVASRIRELPGQAHVRLVAMTGYGQDADRQRAMAAGFADHLVKPVDFAALRLTLADSAS